MKIVLWLDINQRAPHILEISQAHSNGPPCIPLLNDVDFVSSYKERSRSLAGEIWGALSLSSGLERIFTPREELSTGLG